MTRHPSLVTIYKELHAHVSLDPLSFLVYSSLVFPPLEHIVWKMAVATTINRPLQGNNKESD